MASRNTLFKVFSMLAAAIHSNLTMSQEAKTKELNSLNSKSGGVLFGGSHMPSKFPNQRQKRKLNRQTQNFKK